MEKSEISTSSLLQRIFKTSNISRLVNSYEDILGGVPLNVHLGCLCDERGVIPGDVIKKAGIEKGYGYQIFNGIKQHPSRDVVIQIAFGFEMDYNEAQELLKEASKNALHAKVKRDAVIIFALNRKYTVFELQNALEELGLPVLGKV